MLAVYAFLVLILYSLTGCSTPTGMTTSLNPAGGLTPQFASPDGLSADESATLGSLKSVDNYPLYTMTFFGPYPWQDSTAGNAWQFETTSLSTKRGKGAPGAKILV